MIIVCFEFECRKEVVKITIRAVVLSLLYQLVLWVARRPVPPVINIFTV